jgi:hypothetical protein
MLGSAMDLEQMAFIFTIGTMVIGTMMACACGVLWADLRIKSQMEELRALLLELVQKPNQSDTKKDNDGCVHE